MNIYKLLTMKKIFFAVALIATLVSCGNNDKLYFAEVENHTINDPNAEFDTLSYAMGMNYALYLQLKAPELKYDNEVMAQTFINTLSNKFISFQTLESIQRELSERLMPYQNAMRQRMFSRDVTIEIPEIYDENFTNAMLTEKMACVNATMLMLQNTPFNAHYIAEGIRDVKSVQADSLINESTKITVEDAMQFIRKAQISDITKNMATSADAWMADIATKPGVQALEIDGNTIYYRIDNEGGVKPEVQDSIAVNYAVYSYRGRLVESTDSRLKMANEAIEKLKQDTSMTDDARNSRIEMVNKQIDQMINKKIVLEQFRIPAIKHCLPLIGEFGKITIWAPSKFGVRAQSLIPGEPVVITVELNKITKNKVAPKLITPAQPTKIEGQAPAKVSLTAPNGQPAKVVNQGVKVETKPAKGADQPAKISLPARKPIVAEKQLKAQPAPEKK